MRLYYSYGIGVIDIEVSPGQALELIRIEYDDILAINENAGTKSESIVVNNNSPVASGFEGYTIFEPGYDRCVAARWGILGRRSYVYDAIACIYSPPGGISHK